ncbi:formate hydrogenlyase regulator HycA [Ewingella americana]|jgi:formate hydrogenlyase regulatory protein HycA|uniref:Formate hydrogenlyase regulator HycA n=1 Tax=Ewingella americana TaxID=41202 RepID=A0A502GVI8_9GAMM|nr:formate hydrogenlyase regulator HycA [Ewingella americana]TPG64993.1 formate hydrogenlyase regulator HycA [Ewingella americana]
MSTISELTHQADYIASKNKRLKNQWQTYSSHLITAVTQSNKRINHEFICGDGQDICFMLFDYFIVRIQLSTDFYSQDILYSINLAAPSEPEEFIEFAHATLGEDGCVDTAVDISDRNAVLEHYLNKISTIYQCLFDSIHENHSSHAQLRKLLSHA